MRNKVNARTAVAQHARGEVQSAGLPLLATTLSQVVAYTELTHNGRLPRQPPASVEVERLVDELRGLGWLPVQAEVERYTYTGSEVARYDAAKGFKRVGGPPPPNEAKLAGSRQSDSSTAHGPRRDPAAALAAAAAVAPTLPPTRVEAPAPADPVAQLNLKVRTSLIDQLAEAAAKDGTTQKVIVCRALAAAGFEVHEDDLSDRGNHRSAGADR